jgi:hypothetical protein
MFRAIVRGLTRLLADPRRLQLAIVDKPNNDRGLDWRLIVETGNYDTW